MTGNSGNDLYHLLKIDKSLIMLAHTVKFQLPESQLIALYLSIPVHHLPAVAENLSLVYMWDRSKADLWNYTFDIPLCQCHHSLHESTSHRKDTAPWQHQ